MPSVRTADGVTHYIPGVYSSSEVVSELPGPLPEFHIPIIVADAFEGHPYDARSLQYTNETKWSPFRLCSSTADVESYYGKNSPMAIAFSYAKKHGLPFAYCTADNALTRANVIAHSGGAVVQARIWSRTFGAVGGHIKIAVTLAATQTVTVTPVKRSTLLTVNGAIGNVRLYVADNSWLTPGLGVEIGSNVAANVAYTVASTGWEYDANGQIDYWVELTAALAANQLIADYAMIVQYDTAGIQASGALVLGQAVYDWFNNVCTSLGMTKSATWTGAGLIAQAVKPLKEIAAWAAPTAGTSPVGTTARHTSLVLALDTAEWDNFLLDYGLVPQSFLIVSDDVTNHGTWRDWARDKRTEGWPVSITAGAGWGDILLTGAADTSLPYRSNLLDSQDFTLVGNGMNRLDSYLSRAPAVFGMRVGGGVNHNLTNDAFVGDEPEVTWNERVAGNLTTLCRAGVVTNRLLVAGGNPHQVVSEGLSTLQNNASVWNTGTNDTCLTQQRDLDDFFCRVMNEDLDGKQVGADGVSADTIAAVLKTRADVSLEPKGYIVKGSWRITSITLNDSGSGYDIEQAVKYPTSVDFLTVHTQIMIGE